MPQCVGVKLNYGCPLVDDTCLFAIVSHGRQNSPQGLEAHGDVQQMSGEEEVIVMSQNRHGGVPDQIEERLDIKAQDVSVKHTLMFVIFIVNTHIVS